MDKNITVAEILEALNLPSDTELRVEALGNMDLGWPGLIITLRDGDDTISVTAKIGKLKVRAPKPIKVKCPRCGADPGVYCDADGAPESAFLIHVERVSS